MPGPPAATIRMFAGDASEQVPVEPTRRLGGEHRVEVLGDLLLGPPVVEEPPLVLQPDHEHDAAVVAGPLVAPEPLRARHLPERVEDRASTRRRTP